MGIVIDMGLFRRAKTPSPQPPADVASAPKKPSRTRRTTKARQPDDEWDALKRSFRFSPGAPISARKTEAVLALLDFEFPTNIVVDDDGRDYVADFAQHERAREYFRLFGFDIDAYEDADAMYHLWERLDLFAEFVRSYLANPRHFCDTLAYGMPDAEFDYVKAIARQDHESAARLCFILDLDPYTRPWREH